MQTRCAVPQVCPYCGALILPGMTKCPHCGAAVPDQANPPKG